MRYLLTSNNSVDAIVSIRSHGDRVRSAVTQEYRDACRPVATFANVRLHLNWLQSRATQELRDAGSPVVTMIDIMSR